MINNNNGYLALRQMFLTIGLWLHCMRALTTFFLLGRPGWKSDAVSLQKKSLRACMCGYGRYDLLEWWHRNLQESSRCRTILHLYFCSGPGKTDKLQEREPLWDLRSIKLCHKVNVSRHYGLIMAGAESDIKAAGFT